MRSLLSLIIAIFLSVNLQAQTLPRPKLVVGIMVDQMRWDYLYRFYDRYLPTGGFKRMLNQGFTCENTLIPYSPTVTACGHATVYTGSVPAIHGITGNLWWDKKQMRSVYCTEDNTVKTVGSNSSLGKQSPRNLFVTTICDELRLATNFRSKVIGIALKDRGGILAVGHSANASYWYDNTNGNWISSTYFMEQLPSWVTSFNDGKKVDNYYRQGWNLLYPASSYVQSTADEKNNESKPFGPKFPYKSDQFIGKDYGKIAYMPAGNSLTLDFAEAAISAEQLGVDEITDFIAISFSSPDYIGHSFGPNSIESEDGFLRLDRDLGRLLDFLDKRVGKNQYTVFLSADHGVAHVPEFMAENKLPAGRFPMGQIVTDMNRVLFEKYKITPVIVSDDNFQVHLNHPKIDSALVNKKEIIEWIAWFLSSKPGISRVFPLEDLNTVPLPGLIRKMLNNGYYPSRNGDIQILVQPNYMESTSVTGTTHGLWNPYDSHIPLLWYGWGIRQGKTNRETYMTDIAPTIAALLRIQEPSGNVGSVITEVLK